MTFRQSMLQEKNFKINYAFTSRAIAGGVQHGISVCIVLLCLIFRLLGNVLSVLAQCVVLGPKRNVSTSMVGGTIRIQLSFIFTKRTIGY